MLWNGGLLSGIGPKNVWLCIHNAESHIEIKKKKKLLIKKIIPKYWISIIYFKNIIWQYWAYISLLIIG